MTRSSRRTPEDTALRRMASPEPTTSMDRVTVPGW